MRAMTQWVKRKKLPSVEVRESLSRMKVEPNKQYFDRFRQTWKRSWWQADTRDVEKTMYKRANSLVEFETVTF